MQAKCHATNSIELLFSGHSPGKLWKAVKLQRNEEVLRGETSRIYRSLSNKWNGAINMLWSYQQSAT